MFTYWSTDGSSWQCWTKRKLGPRWSCINTTDPSRFWSSEVQVGICMRCCDFSKGRHFFRGFKSHMQTAASRHLPRLYLWTRLSQTIMRKQCFLQISLALVVTSRKQLQSFSLPKQHSKTEAKVDTPSGWPMSSVALVIWCPPACPG